MPYHSGSKRKACGLSEPDAKRSTYGRGKTDIPVSKFHTSLKTIMESKKQTMLAEGIKDPEERNKHMSYLQKHFCKTEKEIGKSVHNVFRRGTQLIPMMITYKLFYVMLQLTF